MTAPTMEQMLDELQEKCFVEAYARESYGAQAVNEANKRTTQAHAAILARFAELERERDAYRADADKWRKHNAPKPEPCDTAKLLLARFGQPRKVEAIKEFRRATGCSLREALDAIDAAIAQRAGETG